MCQVHLHDDAVFTACDSFGFVQLLQSYFWPLGRASDQSRIEDRFCAGHRVCVLKRQPWEQSPRAAGAGHAQENGVSNSIFLHHLLDFYSFPYCFLSVLTGKPY